VCAARYTQEAACRQWRAASVLEDKVRDRPGGLTAYTRETPMHYAILCYHDEKTVTAWSREEDEAVMARLAAVKEKFARTGRLGPTVRLLPTTAATTLRKDGDPPLVLDGPFAETKEQFLGFYLVDCNTLDDVLDFARELAAANPGGAYEIRPVGYMDGVTPARTAAADAVP
jgi:hypothetical protein